MFGPFDVPWPHLAGVAGFGLLSALLAAVVPAFARLPPGRRGGAGRPPRRPGARHCARRSSGVILLGVGRRAVGVRREVRLNGEFLIAGASIVVVLGMILLVPVVVVAGWRGCRGRLPLVVRYAVRDASRHRTRTVPAVAAVAATVAGVVALGIGVSSDEAENAGRYSPSLPMGVGAVTLSDPADGRAEVAGTADGRFDPGRGRDPVPGRARDLRRRRRGVLVAPEAR